MADQDVRLPDTSDPFVLLGVEPHADERTVKRAYARLIKVYRPDRAPAEFERIHAAFEVIQARLRLRSMSDGDGDGGGDGIAAARIVVVAPPASGQPVPTTPDATPDATADGAATVAAAPTAAAPAVADAIATILTAYDRGDVLGARDAVAAAIRAALPFDDILAAIPDAHRRTLYASPVLAWARLRGHPDRPLAHLVFMVHLESVLAIHGAAALAEDIADPCVLGDLDDLELAVIALRAVAALAWASPRARELYDRIRQAPGVARLDTLLDRVEAELVAGRRLQDAVNVRMPAPLLAVLVQAPLANPARFGRLLGELRRDLRADQPGYLVTFDALWHRLPALAEGLLHRLVRETAGEAEELGKIGPAKTAALTGSLRALGKRVPPSRQWVAIVLAVLGAPLVAGYETILKAGAGLIALAVVAAAVIGVTTLAMWRAGWFESDTLVYRERVRPELRQIIVEHGVPSGLVHRWIQRTRHHAGALRRFIQHLNGDPGLLTLSALATLLRTRLDETEPDADAEPDAEPDAGGGDAGADRDEVFAAADPVEAAAEARLDAELARM